MQCARVTNGCFARSLVWYYRGGGPHGSIARLQLELQRSKRHKNWKRGKGGREQCDRYSAQGSDYTYSPSYRDSRGSGTGAKNLDTSSVSFSKQRDGPLGAAASPSYAIDVEFIKTRQQQFARAIAILPIHHTSSPLSLEKTTDVTSSPSMEMARESMALSSSSSLPSPPLSLPSLTRVAFHQGQLLTLSADVVMKEAEALPAGHALLPLLQTHMVQGTVLDAILAQYRQKTTQSMERWKKMHPSHRARPEAQKEAGAASLDSPSSPVAPLTTREDRNNTEDLSHVQGTPYGTSGTTALGKDGSCLWYPSPSAALKPLTAEIISALHHSVLTGCPRREEKEVTTPTSMTTHTPPSFSSSSTGAFGSSLAPSDLETRHTDENAPRSFLPATRLAGDMKSNAIHEGKDHAKVPTEEEEDAMTIVRVGNEELGEEEEEALFSWHPRRPTTPSSSSLATSTASYRQGYRLRQVQCSIPAHFQTLDPYSLPNRAVFTPSLWCTIYDTPPKTAAFQEAAMQVCQVLRAYGKGRGPLKSISFLLQYLPCMLQDVLRASFTSSTEWWDFLGLLREAAREEVERVNRMYRHYAACEKETSVGPLTTPLSSWKTCDAWTPGSTSRKAVEEEEEEKSTKESKGPLGSASPVSDDVSSTSTRVFSTMEKGMEKEEGGSPSSRTLTTPPPTTTVRSDGGGTPSTTECILPLPSHTIPDDALHQTNDGDTASSSFSSFPVSPLPRIPCIECGSLEELSRELSRAWATYLQPPSSPVSSLASSSESHFVSSDTNTELALAHEGGATDLTATTTSSFFPSPSSSRTRGHQPKFYAYGSVDNAVLKRTLALSCFGSKEGQESDEVLATTAISSPSPVAKAQEGKQEESKKEEREQKKPSAPPSGNLASSSSSLVYKTWNELCALPPLPRDRLFTPSQIHIIDITSHPMYAAAGFLTPSRKKISLGEALKKAAAQDATARALCDQARPHDPVWDAQALGCVVVACGVVRPR